MEVETVSSLILPDHTQQALNNSIRRHDNDSPSSETNCELERVLQNLDLNYKLNSGNVSLSGTSTASTTGGENGERPTGRSLPITNNDAERDTQLNTSVTEPKSLVSANISLATVANTTTQLKKRISSSRTPTRKARRIKFYRNGDRFHQGITIPVSNERYRSFASLCEDLTRLLEDNCKITGAVRNIYTMCGKKITSLEELEDGQMYVCSCNNENFKRVEYNLSSQPLASLSVSTSSKLNKSTSKTGRPSSPLKNGSHGGSGGVSGNGTNGSPILMNRSQLENVVHPRIVTLIRNGTRPRKLMRLLLNKRNSPTFDHVLTAITQCVKLDTGYVRKVYTLSGAPVTHLADFFMEEDVFFAYGTERVNNPDDFRLENEEQKTLQAIRKSLRTAGTTCKGPKPKMPIKTKNLHPYDHSSTMIREDDLSQNCGVDPMELPEVIRDRYVIGPIIGDGNFAVVLKVMDRANSELKALKIIDKSKCKGKEHYIDAEVRVMKKLDHPHIISLFLDVDNQVNMFLVMEYISGGDLFDAITRVTRFSEDQSRVMIRHLASAMAYLHSMSIVHRDIKPENLLVELDSKGNVLQLKLADFGLAVEVVGPLFAVCGTPTYVAPEILMEQGYGCKIDVWAAGIILYILLCGFPPFVAPDNQQEPLFDAIISGVYEFPDPYWSDIDYGVRDLIANMLQSDPDVRFTSEDILDHYWTMGETGSYCS